MVADWVYKQDPEFCYIQETHLNNKDRHYIRVKWRKSLPSKSSQETSRVAILIFNKIDFQPKVFK